MRGRSSEDHSSGEAPANRLRSRWRRQSRELLDFRFLFVYYAGVIPSADARTAVAVPCARSAFAPVELPPDLAQGCWTPEWT